MGITEGLGLVFIHLKLSKKINWPWYVVLAPLILPFIVGFFIGVLNGLPQL